MAHKGNQYAAGDLHNQGYVTEKLYMVLQLWCNNKGNPSIELLNLLSELKESIPSSAYLQSMASKITLDSQGRLVLRDNGKIILPYEHFANAVILKHMSGPHGLHLSVDATLRSVMESYTIGKENFGMEREFIVEVVNSCPSTSCRYYKQSPLSFDQQQQQQQQQHQQFASPMNMNSDYLSHMQPPPPTVQSNNNSSSSSMSDSGILSPTQNNIPKLSKSNHQQQQINHQLIQQQNRAMAQQSIENFGSLTALEKQRVMQQLDKKHFETVAAIVQANNNLGLVNQPLAATTNVPQAPQAPHHPQITSIHHPTEVHKAMESR